MTISLPLARIQFFGTYQKPDRPSEKSTVVGVTRAVTTSLAVDCRPRGPDRTRSGHFDFNVELHVH